MGQASLCAAAAASGPGHGFAFYMLRCVKGLGFKGLGVEGLGVEGLGFRPIGSVSTKSFKQPGLTGCGFEALGLAYTLRLQVPIWYILRP